MLRFLSDLWIDESGISSVEYALLLSFVAAGLIVAASVLSGAVVNKMDYATVCIEGGASACV
jgi:Flp pilus assembly pilin Flp